MLYKERCEDKGKHYISVIERLAPQKLVYVDESGINSFMSREYGWSQRGEVILGEKSGKRFARESFVAGLANNKIISPICYQGTMDSALFNFWLSSFLLPEIGPGYTIVMDNAAFHKSHETYSIIKKSGCELLFLPPYSPDLNPIEQCWANLKKIIKNSITQFKSLAQAIDNAFQRIV